MSKLKIAELFYSIQGEGRYMGVPSVFLRTFGCNFKCAGFGMPKGELSNEVDPIAQRIQEFKSYEELPLVSTGCDSYASWDPRFKDLSPMLTTDGIAERICEILPFNEWQDEHLVITGGEPLLGWQRSYPDLLEHPKMKGLKEITFETNGTQELQSGFKDFLLAWQQPPIGMPKTKEVTFSVSPKLSISGEKHEDAIKPKIVKEYEDVGYTYLKFVVETEQHFEEVDKAVRQYRAVGFNGPVYVMPQGGVVTPYEKNRVRVADWACSRGYYYSPRLHVDLWGNGWGK